MGLKEMEGRVRQARLRGGRQNGLDNGAGLFKRGDVGGCADVGSGEKACAP